ncbi:MAG: Cna B-type domain-containing protein [Ruminococcaceae bacterium]|nr:Cna B-type domain-containing protein [Oscillospiraceae bacterium]
MKFDTLQRVAKYSKARKRKKRWQKLVTCLAAVVVFCTAYALILPAITKERPKYCGMQEHTHSASCYEEGQRLLTCDPVVEGQMLLHSHNELCYDAQGNLICMLEELTGHTHGMQCFELDLVCVSDDEAHTHTDGCYAARSLCNLPMAHSHTDTCYAEGKLICPYPEILEHVHNDACFTRVDATLLCEKTEHVHDENCLVDRTADVEREEDWLETLPKEELSENWALDTLSIAESQLGYQESKENYEILPSGVKKGYSRYGAWYGDHYGDWCAMFVSFCLNYAEVDSEFLPFEANCQTWVEKLEELELYHKANEYPAGPGDIIFFDYEGDESADHVGIVVEIIEPDEKEKDKLPVIKTIEGNSSNCVEYKEYSVADRKLMGYCDVDKAQRNYIEKCVHTKTYETELFRVSASYVAAAGIPEEAELMVRSIMPDTAIYGSCHADAEAFLGADCADVVSCKITDFKLYDICFTLDGQEIEPSSWVDVEIQLHDAQLSANESVTVIHYRDDGVEIPDDVAFTTYDSGLTTSFETDSFSLFAVVTTQEQVVPIICLNKFSITSTNIQSLAGRRYMITAGDYALALSDDQMLATELTVAQTDDRRTASEELVCWEFEQSSGTRYYIKTVRNDTNYYLSIADTAFEVVTEKGDATVFTATRSGTNLTIANGSLYLNLSDVGVSAGTSSNLSLYTIPSGEFTVTFDGQIGKAAYFMNSGQSQTYKFDDSKKWDVKTTNNGYVTLPTAEETQTPGNYPLKLNGWYDIINKVFYDSSMLGQQIRVTNNTIFYPEWIPASYDIGRDVNVIKGQPDTSDFIQTHVYDYTELFNTHSANYNESTKAWEFDPNSELGFIFFDYLTTGNIGNISNKNQAVDGVTVNAEKTNGRRGSSTSFPGTITTGIANDQRLEALFGTKPLAGRHNVGEADWLYSFDPDTGFYYYNSAKNAASYNQSEQRFYVYDYVVNIDSQNSLNDFLPLNYGQHQYAEKDNEANYWFGMKSEITFYLPDDSGSGKNKSTNGTDMQLRFSGDDDIWIFIDDNLVLDLGGVHDVVYGEVNFSTGKVTTGQALSSSAIAQDTAPSYADMPGVTYGAAGVTTMDLPDVIEGGKEHKITIYYLERGSSLSNCAVYFNLSPAYELQITKTDPSLNEEGAHDNLPGKPLAGAQFQVFDDAACTTPSTLYIIGEDGSRVESVDSIFTTGADGIVRCWGLFPNKTYYIKEIKPPSGYPGMSEYLIKIDLNAVGEAVIVTLDSNGSEWKFADAYYRSSENEHLIHIDVYNEKFITSQEDAHRSLSVMKEWAEGSENIPDEIEVTLLANGEPTNRKLTIGKEDDWKATFYYLPVRDADGKEIEYSVVETSVIGFVPSYEYVEGEKYTVVVQEANWGTVTTLEDGKTYRFVASSRAVSNEGGSSLVAHTPSETDTEQQWIAHYVTNGFLLQNVAHPTRYMSISTSSATAVVGSNGNEPSGNNVTINLTNGSLKSRATSVGRNASLYYSNGSYRGSAWSSTSFTTYVYNEAIVEEVDNPPYWKVTNTPRPTHINIPIQKNWDRTLPGSSKKEVTFSLYYVAEGKNPELKGTIALNEQNVWFNEFVNMPVPEEGAFYCVIENTTEFDVRYGDNLVKIIIDGKLREASKVVLDDEGKAVQVDITNSFLLVMPATGGVGTQWYTIGGLVLIVASLLLMYKRQKCRKEDYISS